MKLDKVSKAILTTTAKRRGVDAKKLEEIYLSVMKSNFEQDLYDIINENREEF